MRRDTSSKTPSQSDSRGLSSRSRILRVAVTAILLPVALAVAEIVVWGFKGVGEARRDTVAADSMPARLRPGYRGEVWGVPLVTNRYGFRDDEDYQVAPDGEIRVLALGDSIGLGLGVEISDRYTEVLERALNESESGRGVRVINAAGQGYSPSSYYVWFREEGVRFEPSMVVVQIELNNDVTDEALLSWSRKRDERQGPEKVSGGRYVVAWDGSLIGTVARGSAFYERTYLYTYLVRRGLTALGRLSSRGVFDREPEATYFNLGFDRALLSPERIEQGWRQLFDSLTALQRLLAEDSIPLLVLIHPSRFVFEPQFPRKQVFARDLMSRAADEAARRGIPYLDPTDALSKAGGAGLYFDFAHPTVEGHRAIGQLLADRISACSFRGAGVSTRPRCFLEDSKIGKPAP